MSCHAAKGALLTTASGKGRSRASSRRRCEEGLSRCGGGGTLPWCLSQVVGLWAGPVTKGRWFNAKQGHCQRTA